MKILISGEIEIMTGLHIGGSSDFSAIGAIDSPVVRDALTKQPIIPGSSIKGKMRYLLARKFVEHGLLLNEPNEDSEEVLRLFGSSEKNNIKRARLKFNDCFFSNLEELDRRNVHPTEIKFENTIDRRKAEAKPRQIERVIAGSKFKFELFYTVENKEETLEDFKNIKMALDLLEYDYLGGHGTRGSGRVKFVKLTATNIVGEFEKITELDKILKGGN